MQGVLIMIEKIVESKWDYTKHAKFYEYRPNYAKESIAMLKALISYEGGGSCISC